MSRLIDADRLLKELGQVWNIPDDWDGDIDETCETAFDIIENQPTAYDLDKVVRELQERSWGAYSDVKLIWLSDAIEIVKRGGIDE